jgi:hypothetical protein
LEIVQLELKFPDCVKELEKGKSPLTPFLLFIMFLWDEKTDMLLCVNEFRHENVDGCMTTKTTKNLIVIALVNTLRIM